METGTRAQCFNAPEGATERANKSKKREKRKPAAHSPEDTHFLSVSLTQHPGGRGGWGPHTHFPHYPRIKAREIIVRIIKEGNLKKKKLHFLTRGPFSYLPRVSTDLQVIYSYPAGSRWSVWETFQHTDITPASACSTHMWYITLTLSAQTEKAPAAICSSSLLLLLRTQSCPIIVCGLGAGKPISSMRKMIHLA